MSSQPGTTPPPTAPWSGRFARRYAIGLPEPRVGIKAVAVGHRTVLTVSGELDVATTPDLARATFAAFDAGAHELWIDLSDTGFADSSAVRCLLEAHRRASELRRRLAVICPAGPVRRILALSGAGAVLPLFPTRHDAHQRS